MFSSESEFTRDIFQNSYYQEAVSAKKLPWHRHVAKNVKEWKMQNVYVNMKPRGVLTG